MKPEGKGYILKEYGSWSVLTVAFFTGLGVSREFPWQAVPLFLSLCLLINSKQAYTKWTHDPSASKHLVVFLGQMAAGSAVLFSLFGGNLPQVLPLLILPTAYLPMNRFAGEHHVLTELLGFALLSLAAVLAKFLVVQGVEDRKSVV